MMVSRLSPIANQNGYGITSQRARDRMIDRLRAQGITDGRVLAAMAKVPRHLFVDEGFQTRAYEDTALPIGFAQTISQPWVVARTVELVLTHFDCEGSAPQKILEIGTGCGYQAAVLAPFDAAVVAAGGLALSPEFFAQIAPGGVVVAPVGDARQQVLTVFRNTPSGWVQQAVANVMFVPLLGGVA